MPHEPGDHRDVDHLHVAHHRGESGPQRARLSGREQIASDEQFDLLDRLERYARERDVSLLEVAIGALLARPVISSVIAGATKPDQVRANAAAGRWQPGEDDLQALRELLG